jgi:hypothetical protein
MRDSGLFGVVMKEALATGTVVRFRAEGGSMYPTIRDGDTITIAAVSAIDVVRGDVLLYRHGQRVLAHRVVGVGAHGGIRMFCLRGDAMAECDAPVGASDVVGRVISVWRHEREVRLSGRTARLRHTARTAASRAKTSVASSRLSRCVRAAILRSHGFSRIVRSGPHPRPSRGN